MLVVPTKESKSEEKKMLNCYFLYNGEKKKTIVSYNGSGKANSLSFSSNVAYLLEKSERKFVIIVDFFWVPGTH